jgi:hypothetical protein
MKRIVVLIDGTRQQEGIGRNTNVGLLDPDFKIAGSSLIKSCDKNGVRQVVEYQKGVGAVTDPIGGLIGEGLRNLVIDAYASLAKLYELRASSAVPTMLKSLGPIIVSAQRYARNRSSRAKLRPRQSETWMNCEIRGKFMPTTG